MSKDKKLSAIDLFSGAGGMSLGFSMAGFKILYALDNDPACIETYNKNLGSHGHVGDIYEINKNVIEALAKQKIEGLDVIFGGPPCQGFSVQRRGENNDPRNQLVMEYIRLVLEVQPKFFVMENVAGLLSTRGKPVLKELEQQCEKAGYLIHIQKLNAFDFGVPQVRKRVFIVGEKTESPFTKFTFPEPTRPSLNTPSTVREAISDLMITDDELIHNHRADKLSPINLERIRSITEGQGRDSLPEHLQLDCHKNNSTHRHLDVYGRMAWDKPSSTITARFDSFSRGRFGHPELDRTITLREGARLQTFPDGYIFYGTKVQVAKQIGNAVPPLLANAIATKIKEILLAEGDG
ncbi:DNA (cytosine-5)-methyltransferase 1 [Paenibacillus sp. 1_12]|uniref:DNA cytosine methyltransferase n=1 Tax=Paenibacillus sp. 1_12 TaxID=1566278 RepID=UPI0008E9AC4A|nr:DNA cytosine methyltransferase [Paenibacillus sp. 1_12]SFK75867.1 DNA (cytosine-5)-methyltransferase 1 [Paenibacillus sp. 1_12]